MKRLLTAMTILISTNTMAGDVDIKKAIRDLQNPTEAIKKLEEQITMDNIKRSILKEFKKKPRSNKEVVLKHLAHFVEGLDKKAGKAVKKAITKKFDNELGKKDISLNKIKLGDKLRFNPFISQNRFKIEGVGIKIEKKNFNMTIRTNGKDVNMGMKLSF